ncbi:TolC family outer membrane protein [Haliea sp. E17]|uniref:TolC family outer membrane protein n=1 Tax=Haliea sp. E17 TaxID=3401576 RepID=UPI003AABA827
MPARADSLLDIYELALENDAQLKTEEAQYMANREAKNLGLAGLLPQVGAQYARSGSDYDTKSENLQLGPDGVVSVDSNTTTDTITKGWQVSLSQPLFDLAAWFDFKQGKELTKQAESTFAGNQQNLIVRVVQAYLAVLRAQDNLEASKAQERAFERQLEQTQQRFDVGLIAITDVYEAQAAYDLSQVNRIVDENSVAVALEQLSVLTGQKHDNLNVLGEDFPITPPQPTDRAAWVDFALQNNFSLQAARYAEEAARQASHSSTSEHAPTITGTYAYSDNETDGSRTIRPATDFLTSPYNTSEGDVWELRVQMPLFAGGGISAQRRRSAQEYLAAQESRVNLMRNTVTNTRSLHMTVMSDVTRVAARKQSIVSSKSALDATQAGYEVGTRNVVDVLNAQQTLYAAERDYSNSRYDYVIDLLQLKEQAGLLSPEDVIKLNSFLKEAPPPSASATTTTTR